MAEQNEKKLADAEGQLLDALKARQKGEAESADRINDLQKAKAEKEKAMMEANMSSLFGMLAPSLGAMVNHIMKAGDALSTLFGGKENKDQTKIDKAEKEAAERLEQLDKTVKKASEALDGLRESASKATTKKPGDKEDNGKEQEKVAPVNAFTDALQRATAVLNSIVGGKPSTTGIKTAEKPKTAEEKASEKQQPTNPFANLKADVPKMPNLSTTGGAGGAGGLGAAGGAGGAGGAGAAGGAGGGAMAGMGAAAGALAGVAGAAMAAVSAVQELLNKIRGFVEAINPSVLETFDMVINNLNATIGTAFQGVFEQLIPVVDQFSGMLMPVMQQLKPIIDQLVAVAVTNLIPRLKLFATIIESLLPLLKILILLWEMMNLVMRPVIMIFQLLMMELGFLFQLLEVALMPVIEGMKLLEGMMDNLQMVFDVMSIVLKSIIQTFVQFLKSLLPAMNMEKILDGMTKAVKEAIKAYLWFAATIYKALGFTEMLKNMAKDFKPEKGATAAIKSTSFKSLESVSKEMALAAAKASGGSGKQKSQEDFMAEMSTLLEKIASGEETSKLGETLNTLIRDYINPIKEAVQKIANIKKFVGEQVKKGFSAQIDPFGYGYGDKVADKLPI